MTTEETLNELEKAKAALKLRGTELSAQKVEKLLGIIENAISKIGELAQ